MAHCCEATQVVLTQYHTLLCINCGREKAQLVNGPDYNTYMTTAPLARHYSRPERWNILIKKVCGLHSGPPTTDPVWDYLKAHQPYNSPKDIIKCLRKAKLKNKHYPSLHAFCQAFDSSYVKPLNANNVMKHLSSYFEHVISMWNTKGNKHFFSYSWLIEQGLEIFNHITYLPYVKKLMCPFRRNKYAQELLTLYGTHVGNCRHGTQDNHLRYERSRSLNLHNQLPQNLWPIVERKPRAVRVGRVCLPPGLQCMLIKSLGGSGNS